MTKTEWSVRPATEEDLNAIGIIERQAHISPWLENHFREELEKPYSVFLVLTDDETDSTIAGYIVCWIMSEECQIINIAVDLPFRGLGLAQGMIRKCIQIADSKGVSRISLEVRKSNTPAIQLYQKVGFAITHIRKSFYSNGEDAYHMVLALEGEPVQF